MKKNILNYLLLICIPLFGGCSITTRQSSLDPKGPVAAMQLDLFMVTVWVSLFIFVVVGGILLWVVFRYRDRGEKGEVEVNLNDHGNPVVEIFAIVLSVVLLVIIAIPTIDGVIYMHELPDSENAKLGEWYQGHLLDTDKNDILEINVIGYQWWWKFEYPQFGFSTANEMAIPVGKPVKINLRANDVIHSFWLPKIAGKVDLIPGRANWMWIQGDEVGHYYGQCAEFCGSAHAYMLFRADVLSLEDFPEWVEHQKKDANVPQDPIAIEGEKLFLKYTCVQCHMIRGNALAMGVKGPDLTHVASRRSLAAGILDSTDIDGNIDFNKQRENMFNWIMYSERYKPGNLMYNDVGGLKEIDLKEEDVRKIVYYLQTLK